MSESGEGKRPTQLRTSQDVEAWIQTVFSDIRAAVSAVNMIPGSSVS